VTQDARPAEGVPAARPRPSLGALLPMFLLLTVAIVELLTHRAYTILLVNPLTNALVVLDIIVLGQFGLAIILFTVLLRVATLPMTINTYRSMKAMQAMQPKIQEIDKKYKDPKRRNEERAKLMRESGFNPLGCAFPMLIQIVPFFALFAALRLLVGGSPESVVSLSQHLYPIPALNAQVPINQHFLWLNLGQPDPYYIIPALVFITTYITQKMTSTAATTPQQQQQQQMMAWMMPMMFVIFTLNAPSGVGLYWVASSVFSIFSSYYVYGRTLNWRQILLPGPVPAATPEPRAKRVREAPSTQSDQPESIAPPPAQVDGSDASGRVRPAHGKRRGRRKNRR
jgi:YidC/Oxa1 family membrane protein insertase